MTQAARPAPVLALAATLASLALAGCLSGSTPPTGLGGVAGLGVPGLPSLAFAKELGIDPDHRGGEPSILVDHDNNYYVSAPSGFVSTIFNSVVDPTLLPAQGPTNRQSFIWKSTDQGASWDLLSITPPPLPPLRGDAAPGGADTDLAIDGCGTVYFTDLWLGNIAVSHSDDGGATWTGTPVTGILPVLDRNWIAAGEECGTVYLLYQTFYSQMWVLKSTDKGMTWPQQVLVMDCNTGPECYAIDGPIVVDQATGNLYFIAGKAEGQGIWVFRSSDQGQTWDKAGVDWAADINNIFPVLATDAAGNIYAVFSALTNGSYNVYLTVSTDQGATFSAPVSVSGPEDQGTEVFPWVAAGDAGRVAVGWLGNEETVERTDDVEGDWFVTVAASYAGHEPGAAWTIARMSERPNHKGEICTLGLTCTLPQPVGTRGNRNLADFFEMAIDNEGRLVASWPDDYDVAEQFISLPYFGRQSDGMRFREPKADNATAMR